MEDLYVLLPLNTWSHKRGNIIACTLHNTIQNLKSPHKDGKAIQRNFIHHLEITLKNRWMFKTNYRKYSNNSICSSLVCLYGTKPIKLCSADIKARSKSYNKCNWSASRIRKALVLSVICNIFIQKFKVVASCMPSHVHSSSWPLCRTLPLPKCC